MNDRLAIGFYAEGITDIRFLSKVISRTTEQIISNRSSFVIDIYDPSEIKVKKTGDRSLEIRQAAAAAKASGYNILIIHTDADDKTDEKAFKERIKPGFELFFLVPKRSLGMPSPLLRVEHSSNTRNCYQSFLS